MHLLAATPGRVDDGKEPVDLEQTPSDILFLSAADTELAALSEARAEIVADAVRSRGLPISAVARALGLSLGGASRALGRACPGRRSLK